MKKLLRDFHYLTYSTKLVLLGNVERECNESYVKGIKRFR